MKADFNNGASAVRASAALVQFDSACLEVTLHFVCAVTDKVQSHFKTCGIKLHKRGTGTDGRRAVVEVGFHSLRHTFVSLCRESNAPLAVVESIVGHGNPAMTRLGLGKTRL